jgi:hypothetical protein
MPRALKVYGYRGYVARHGQVRQVVAARSQREAADKLNTSLHDFRRWGGETGNLEEETIAISRPGTVFYTRDDFKSDHVWKSIDGFAYKLRERREFVIEELGEEAEDATDG